jgi:hypothetical protein
MKTLTAEQQAKLQKQASEKVASSSNSGLASEIYGFLSSKPIIGKAQTPSMIAKGINADKDDIRHCMQKKLKLSSNQNGIIFNFDRPMSLEKGNFGTERNGYKVLTDAQVKSELDI